MGRLPAQQLVVIGAVLSLMAMSASISKALTPSPAVPSAPKLAPDSTFTLTFPDLPPTFDELGNPGNSTATLIQFGQIALAKGHWYELTFRIRSSNLRQVPQVDLQDCVGWKSVGLNKKVRTGPDWTPAKFDFLAQRDLGPTGRFQLVFFEPGTVDVADVKIVEIAALPVDRNEPAQPINSTDLVANGDFSKVKGGKPDHWQTSGSKKDVDQTLTAEKDPDGTPFARLTCTRCDHTGRGNQPMMTVHLPKNYDADHKFPLLIFLAGGTGGVGDQIGQPLAISENKDFITVNLPLFREAEAVKRQTGIFLQHADAQFAWQSYKKMLAKLGEIVPNIDCAHRIIGGFSNGAHTTGGLIEATEGEAAAYFSAFYLVEGGGGLQRFASIKGKPLIILYGAKNGGAWADRMFQAAVADGVNAQVVGMANTGHDFPAVVYPRFRQWLRGPALGPHAPAAAEPSK